MLWLQEVHQWLDHHELHVLLWDCGGIEEQLIFALFATAKRMRGQPWAVVRILLEGFRDTLGECDSDWWIY